MNNNAETVGWTLFGVTVVVAILIFFLSVVDATNEGDLRRQHQKTAKIEACSSIEDDLVKSLCINGFQAEN